MITGSTGMPWRCRNAVIWHNESFRRCIARIVNRGDTDNNKWEWRLDDYLDSLEKPLAAIPEIRRRWGTPASVVATPFATLLFIAKALLTSPWGLFLAAGRFLGR